MPQNNHPMYNPNTEQQDLFNNETQLVQASGGKRFVNYLVDLLIFYVIFFLIFFTIAVNSPSTIDGLDDDSVSFGILDRLLSLLLYGLYMFIVETIFKGKSIGKFITGTRAVNEDGTPITAKTALLRGLSRAVPFNAFSALGDPSYPWHDKWNHTYVIDERKSTIIQ